MEKGAALKKLTPLSFQQEGIWFLTQLKTIKDNWDVGSIRIYTGKFRFDVMPRVVYQLVKQHEALRTVFCEVDGEPRQYVLEPDSIDIEDIFQEVDLTSLPGELSEKKANEIYKHDLNDNSFDLSRGPLLKIKIIRVRHDKIMIYIIIHHIISDLESVAILWGDMIQIYNGIVSGEGIPVKSSGESYFDFVRRKKHEYREGMLQEAEEYWRRQFLSPVSRLQLPTDFGRSSEYSSRSGVYYRKIDQNKKRRLERISIKNRVSLFTTLFSAYYLLLSKYTLNDDIIIGVPFSGRDLPKTHETVGFFINTAAIRVRIPGDIPVRKFLKQVNKTVLDAYKYQYYPLEKVVDLVGPDLRGGNTSIFQTTFNMNTTRTGTTNTFIGLVEEEMNEGQLINPYLTHDLSITIINFQDCIVLVSDYRLDLFKKETMERMMGHYEYILDVFLNHGEMHIQEIELLSEEERRRILFTFNDTENRYPLNKTLQRLFEEQLEKYQDMTAAVYENHHLSYRALSENGKSLAWLLRKKGVGPGVIVILIVNRSLEMLTGILGILKAGGAYLPIDPQYPEERIKYMLKDTTASIVVTQQELIEKRDIDFHDRELLYINEKLSVNYNAREDEKKIAPSTASGDLAYVIYTSGSTGKPKAVTISHRNVINFIFGITTKIKFIPGKAILALTTLSFDIFVLETLLPLVNGLKIVIATGAQQKDPQLLAEKVVKENVNMLQMTPSHLSLLNDSEVGFSSLANVEVLMVGGESFPRNLFEKLKANYNGNIYNMYGPTETTVWSSLSNLTLSERIDIGTPIANTQIYIIDKSNRIQPIGIPGELYIGGDGVARGYLNQPELTLEKFERGLLDYQDGYNRSYKSYKSYILYKTGDLARWLPDGNIECLGRIDNQIKLRGFRIELEEIENQLLNYGAIKNAALAVKSDNKGDKYLCAYIVSQKEIDLAELREFLSANFPDYMIPSYFMQVESLPLTPNGKIDRKMLGQIEIEEIKTAEQQQTARNELEKKLSVLWSQLPGIEKDEIGIDMNFFQIGGHSLNAAVLVARINKELDVNIPLGQIFKTPTIRRLGEFIEKAVKSPFASLEKSERKEYYSLSSAQKRLYITQQMDLAGKGYNLPLVVVLEGDIEVKRLERVFRQLIQRHESLRTSFIQVKGEPLQRIHDEVEFEIEIYQVEEKQSPILEGTRGLAPLSEESQPSSSSVIRHLSSDFVRPFDLSRAPLLRVGLIKENDQKHILMLDMHHLITDGTSMMLLIREIITLYQGGKLDSLRLQYTDYSQWRNSLKVKETIKKHETFWLKQFADEIPVLDLPLDFKPPAVQSFEGKKISFQMGKEETRAFKELAEREGVTLFVLLLAVYNILLAKLSGQEDILIGTALAGRNHTDLEKIIGLFLNTLALRNYPRCAVSFKVFLEEVRERTLEAFEHQDYPFEELIEKLDIPQGGGSNPLYRVMLLLQNFESFGLEEVNKQTAGFKVKPYDIKSDSSTDDITLFAQEEDTLSFLLQYRTKLFKTATIDRFIRYFNKIAAAVVVNPDIKLMDIEIITPEEKEQILFRFNQTAGPVPRDKNYRQLFRRQALKKPDRVAAVSGEQRLHVTYSQLHERANRIAAFLRHRGQGTDTDSIIAVYMNRNVNMLTSIIGIFNAGYTYLPLEVDYPEERIKNILEDCRVNLLITESRAASAVKKIKAALPGLKTVVYLDDAGCIAGFPVQNPVTNPIIDPGLQGTAYVIFTSGSTGKPKGVMIHHLGMLNHLYAMIHDLAITGEDIIAQTASACFDISVWQFLTALLTGGITFIIDRAIILEPARLLKVLREGKITILEAVPSLAGAILSTVKNDKDKGLPHLKWMIMTGEALGINLVREWYKRYPGIKLLNAYGPAEASDDVTLYVIDELPGENQTTVPIGKPVQNMHVYILDKNLSLCPIGVRGEICLAGLGVGKGYWREPHKTQQVFIPNPFSEEINDNDYMTIYKTGDIGYFREDGLVEFIGRNDQQVKVRGYRIELTEIESQLAMVDDIEEVVVSVISMEGTGTAPGDGEKYICAYYVSKKGIDSTHLRDQLSQRLPHYMVPSFFIPLEQLPLSPNGKIDRKALPVPEIKWESDYIPPDNEKEEKLVAIFSEVLSKNTSEISVEARFFEIGGHSLLAIKVVSLIKEIFQVKISLSVLFQDGTVRGIARRIKKPANNTEKLTEGIKERREKRRKII